ncbi:hypothetical protein D0B32_08825 [Paraburkholderia sp. DHOC27]|nr:hypothetical protein D0B32_08825 [Paraburkholderia sp. DHOC27]
MKRMCDSILPLEPEAVSLEARKGARKAIRNYSIATGVVTALVLTLSCLLFIVEQISHDISHVVSLNDPIAMTLHNQLQAYDAQIIQLDGGATPEILVQMQNSQEAVAIKEDLQKFATNNRQLYSDVNRARGIGQFLFRIPNAVGHLFLGKDWGDDWGSVSNRYAVLGCAGKQSDWQCDPEHIRRALEIDLPLFDLGMTPDKKKRTIPEDTVKQGFQKISVYQDIRAMAMYSRDIILSFVGSITGFLLPILYAALGACASILRKLRSDTVSHLFHPEYSKVANRAHITTAVIVGISIGLFSDIVRGGAGVSPLGLAFVAGYASDKFFEFVDRIVHSIFPSVRPRDVDPVGADPKPNVWLQQNASTLRWNLHRRRRFTIATREKPV